MLSSPHLCCLKSSSVSPQVHPHTIPGQLQKKISGRRQDQWQDPQQWSHRGRRQDQSSRSMALLIPSLYWDVQQSITSLPLFYMVFIIYSKCKATYVQYLVHTNTTKWIIYKLSALFEHQTHHEVILLKTGVFLHVVIWDQRRELLIPCTLLFRAS